MKYEEFIKEYEQKNNPSVYTEFQRNIWKRVKIKFEGSVTIEQILKLKISKYHQGESIKFGKRYVFVEKVDKNNFFIIYKIEQNYYQKQFSIIKNKVIYKENIKFFNPPWGIRRVYLKYKLRQEVKQVKLNIANAIKSIDH